MGFLSLIAQLGININHYVQGLFKARHHAQEFGRDVAGDLKRDLAGAFGTGAVLEFAAKTVEKLGALTDAAERLDTTTTKLQEWYYAAGQAGASAEQVTKFFESINQAQNEALNGNEEKINAFKRLGVTIKDLQTLRTDDLGRKIANSIKKGDIQVMINDLAEVGGKAGRALIPTFKEGIDEAAAAAHQLGQIIEDSTIAKVDQLGDRLKAITTTLMGPMATLLAWLNSAFTWIAKAAQLAGAYSGHFNPKKFQFDQTIGEFLKSKDAQDIISAPEEAPSAKGLPHPKRKFTPPKEIFDNDILGAKIGRFSADSLAGVGGFLGNAANQANMVDIARQQLMEQKKIAKNTEPKNSGDKFSYQ
jgi:hypothetical protein